MDYDEIAPPAHLCRHVQCLWRLRALDAPMPTQTVYPDGRCELIVHLGQPMSRYLPDLGWRTQTACLFAAQMRSAVRLAANGPVDCLGVRLTPPASRLLVGDALLTLIDHIVDLTDAYPAFAASLQTACQEVATHGDPAPVWRCLQTLATALDIDAAIAAAVEEIDAACGDIGIAQLARAQRISMRSLQSRFLRSVGLTAKEYARVQRLQATLKQLDRHAPALADLAIAAGFADQAHATRELVRLTGLTPGKLRHALLAEREGDATLRMAAAFVRGHMRMPR